MLVCCASADACLRAVVAGEIYCFAAVAVMSDVAFYVFLNLTGQLLSRGRFSISAPTRFPLSILSVWLLVSF